MRPPLVSIIIPAFNSVDFIGETIESVRSQTLQDFEVLVVDDGSTDNQKDVINNYVLKDNRIKYIFQENMGVSAARNNGFKLSCGKYIAFLDADDIWLPENLELKASKFQTGDFGLVHSNAVLIDEKSDEVPGGLSGKEGDLLEDLLLWNGTQIPGPSSILVKREVIEQIGPFDEQLSTSADQDFFFRVASRFRIGKVDKVTWKYRLHKHNMHKNISVMERDVLYVFKKAQALHLFHSKSFERKCFSVTCLILAASWAGDGKSKKKAIRFLFKAMCAHPATLGDLIRKKITRWI